MRTFTFFAFMMLFVTASTFGQAYSGGSGTIGSPYQIANKADLKYLSENSGEWTKHFIQTADIYFTATDFQSGGDFYNGGEGWIVIGKYNNIFTGTYNGDRHIVDSLYMNRPATMNEHQGMFGYISNATIQNLGVTNVTVIGGVTAGGMVGHAQIKSIVRNCFSTGMVSGKGSVGGLVGVFYEEDTLSNCYSTCTVSELGIFSDVGGLLGYNNWSSLVNNCYATGRVTGTNAGGLIGNNNAYIRNSFYNTDTISAGIGTTYSPEITATGKTTAEMKQYATFYGGGGWDFMDETFNGTEDIWGINALLNDGYPFLFVQGYTNNPQYVVVTLSVSNLSSTSVTLNGASGDLSATHHGFCWSTLTNPTLSSSNIDLGPVTLTGHFDYNLSGLTAANTYYVRAFSISGTDTTYGHMMTFTTRFWDGYGTEINPFLIANTTDLKNLSENPEWWSFHFLQVADITFTSADFETTGGFFNSGEGMIPIGNSDTNFTGYYNGSGYFIDSIYMNRSNEDDQGFFGYTQGARLRNIGLRNVSISGASEVGGLVGWSNYTSIDSSYITGTISGSSNSWAVGGLVGYNSYTDINHSYAAGTVTVTDIGVWDIGGLIGYNEYSSVMNSHADVNVDGEGDVGGLTGVSDNCSYFNTYATGITSASDVGAYSSFAYAGGFTGDSWNSTYTNCYATGNVSSAGGYTGGFAGEFVYDTAINCYATGNVLDSAASENSYAGGFAGECYKSIISYCSASGNVHGHYYIGGLAGESDQSLIEFSSATGTITSTADVVGGLVGKIDKGSIQNSYATGNVSSNGASNAGESYDIGGLVGGNYSGTISNSFATGNVSGYSEVGGLVGINWTAYISPVTIYAITTNCYSVGNVTGHSYTGGLIGRNTAKVTDCYSACIVTGDTLTGGLSGPIDNHSEFTDCFWDTETSTKATSYGGTGKTTEEMKCIATYTDTTTFGLITAWDFITNPIHDTANNDYWDMDQMDTINSGYPVLSWQAGADAVHDVTAGTVSGPNPVCIGETPTFTSNGTSGGKWTSGNISVATVDSLTGVVTAIAYGTSDIFYNVKNCGSTVSAFTTIIVNPLPDVGLAVAGSETLCEGTGTIISVAFSETGVNYQLRNDDDDSDVGTSVTGTGGTINLPTGNLAETTTFNILATYIATACSVELTETEVVIINALPVVSAGNYGQPCINDADILLAGNPAGGVWSGTGVSGTGPYVFDPSSGTQTLTYTYTDINSCTNADVATIDVNLIHTFTENQSICSGDSLLWQGSYRKTAGLHYANYTTDLGCDSIYTLELTVDSVDISLTVADPTITANLVGGTYQWLDCDNAYLPISGATLQGYTAVSNGNYAVLITEGLCSDTSECIQILTVGITAQQTKAISIYPNPFTEELIIEIKGSAVKSNFEILNSLGQIVIRGDLHERIKVQTSGFSSGVYLIKIENGKTFEYKKIIKE